ncbi:7327_t:CDS:2 [Scutellospora calospora]|uniref:7327_t:CDS:1 n=1 Tax=Scutellospora calospora TaxID=85575 RepID=A0ACA9K4C8_9GLOM|nr:7327_t:CDS:2 [Scutellospora calospora]
MDQNLNLLNFLLKLDKLINHLTSSINLEIINIIQNNEFWNEVQNLLVILKILVSGITIFEENILYLSQFYKWYEKLEKNETYRINARFQSQSLANNIMTTVSDFVKKYYSESCTKIYSQLLEYINHSGLFNNSMAWEIVNNVDQITCENNSEFSDEDELEIESNIDYINEDINEDQNSNNQNFENEYQYSEN